VLTRPDHVRLQPGWLFDTSGALERSTSDGQPTADDRQRSTPNPESRLFYQLWATNRDCRQSVLFEHSKSPASAPAWGPIGRSVAYARFVLDPSSLSQPGDVERGHFEVVIQDGLDRRRVVWSSAPTWLDSESRAVFPQSTCAWSPDGTYLAVPCPGRPPSVVIVRLDTKKCVQTLVHAILPSWSQDGRKCAFIHREDDFNALAVVERDGSDFGTARQLVATGRFTAPVFWSADGRSIYAVLEKARAGSHEPELARIFVETGDVLRLIPLAPEPHRRTATIRGLTIDIDREAERCFYSVDLEGRDTDLVWTILNNRPPFTQKRSHPLDGSQRLGAIAASPDGRLLAARLLTSRGLTPPAVWDLETDQTTLLVPDESSRLEWLSELSAATGRLLRAGLPPAKLDGEACVRPTILPLPGEAPILEGVGYRVARLARQATGLLDRASIRNPVEDDQVHERALSEVRLAFAYLRGDFVSASAELDRLELQVSTLPERLALLGVRAQVLWSQGDTSTARSVIDFLVSTTAAQSHHVDETTLGLVLTPNPNQDHRWARFMAMRAAPGADVSLLPNGDQVIEPPEPAFRNPFGAPDRRPLDRAAGGIPFAPIFPGLWGRDLDKVFGPEPQHIPKVRFTAP
jgi:Tol biopolymer transport system component